VRERCNQILRCAQNDSVAEPRTLPRHEPAFQIRAIVSDVEISDVENGCLSGP
jgi:hypothetical protein